MRARNDDLIRGFMKDLTEYTEEIASKVYTAADKLSRAARSELTEIPIKRTGVYRKSWKVKRFKGKKGFRLVIHNEQKYRITHLLENGFIHYPDGNTVEGRPHIGPTQDRLNEDFYKACVDIIEKEE